MLENGTETGQNAIGLAWGLLGVETWGMMVWVILVGVWRVVWGYRRIFLGVSNHNLRIPQNEQ